MRISADRCAFCDVDGAMISCDWRVDRPETIDAGDLWTGDQVEYGPHGFAAVVRIERPNPDAVRVTVRTKAGREFSAMWRDWARVVSMQNVPCRARCCEACAQERSERFHCCPAHYTALDVAA